uniref:t-SNARE coiled-coil homology domain-containing protein n=1 Tax=Eutreptiella gymnastica TaxID=73025 RepID=A0A7S1NQ25_9EUGL|mmetsp:Transcript_71346/g.125598  ORF Transcript_71346/g.125598 Transcript_71346/m.125598 type:complete len:311 (+) Transcript_71346:41-973(+)
MATRNITTRYFQLRNAIKGSTDRSSECSDLGVSIEEGLLQDVTSFGAEAPPIWVETLDRVKQIDGAIKSRMAQLRDLHTTHLKPQFGKDEEKEEREINVLTMEIKQLFKDSEKAIKKMVQEEGNIAHKSNDQQKLLQNVQLSLVTQMSALSKAFGDDQRKYLSEVKKQKDRAKKLVSFGSVSPEEEEQERREAMMTKYMEKGFTPEQIAALEFNEQVINERDLELQHIYSSIVDLHEVFKDLNALVIDQGTLLDRIDYNIEETKKQVMKANEQLNQIAEGQRKSKFVSIVLCQVVCIFILLLLILMKFLL